MKHRLTTIAAVLLVGCGKASNPEADSTLLDLLQRDQGAKKGNI
ncbi:MAG: hypothetical protein NZ577_00900 [Vicinamibacterales bacterium]|nr:hypothetical protein [Vicinamibacterales bacterium]|tara:strand:+ start:373 stop:504 length:132 start_codon:yes stop_codon:yes gene_type:complete